MTRGREIAGCEDFDRTGEYIPPRMSIHEQVGTWLDELASAAPAPGGGAAAALSAAMGASLVCMVCNLTLGKPKFAAFEAQNSAALAAAEQARRAALQLADDDARVFEAVIAAYKLPRATDDERAARTAAVQDALVAAAAVPLRTAELAATVIGLAAGLLEGTNPNVVSDIAVAASTARAALDASVVNVEINLASITDDGQRRTIGDALARHSAALAQADAVVADVRKRIVR